MGGIRTADLPVAERALYPLDHGDPPVKLLIKNIETDKTFITSLCCNAIWAKTGILCTLKFIALATNELKIKLTFLW